MIKATSPKLRLLFSFLIPFLSFAQDCDLNYTPENTGSNMIIMINGDALTNEVLVAGDSLGAFMNINEQWVCVGGIEWTEQQQTLAIWGNDANNFYQDGLMAMDEVVLKAQSNGVLYDITYAPTITFVVNGITILNSTLSMTPVCDDLGNVYGCTNQSYVEYSII